MYWNYVERLFIKKHESMLVFVWYQAIRKIYRKDTYSFIKPKQVEKKLYVHWSSSFVVEYAVQENANGVRLMVVKELPPLQEREQQSRGRYGDGCGGFGNRRGGGRSGGFSQGGRVSFSDRRNDRFPRGAGGGGRGRGAYKKW